MTEIKLTPDIVGVRGKAWLLKSPPPEGRLHSTIATYLVEATGYHPFWNRWLISVIHLRDVDGLPPAVIRLRGATHELMVYSLDPAHYAEHSAAMTTPFRLKVLSPADVVEQFQVPADQFAERLLTVGVTAVCEGIASPDSDHRTAWHKAIQETAQLYRENKGAGVGLA